MIKQLLQKATNVIASTRGARQVESDTDMQVPVALTNMRRPANAVSFGKLDLIVIPQSAMDAFPNNPHPLIDAVVGYVNFLLHDAGFQPSEIPAEAMQVFRCDEYHAHVCQGGHGHFVENNTDNLTTAISDLMCGLIAMGEAKYQRIAGDMATCVATGEVDSDALNKLDQPFYIHDKTTRFSTVLAAWIAQIEIMLTVPDDTLSQVYCGIALLDKKRAVRAKHDRAAQFSDMLDDPMKLGCGLAGGMVKNPLIGIGGSLKMDVDGEMTPAWLVYAAKGKCWGVMNDDGVALMARVIDDENETAYVGDALSQVSYDEITASRDACVDLNAAVAIDMLVSQHDPEMNVDFLSVHEITDMDDHCLMIYVVASDGDVAFTARITAQDAILLAEPTHDVLVRLTRLEIEQYAQRKTQSIAA